MVTPLRRVTLQKRQSNQNASAPAYGPRCAQVSLTPVPLRGHAVTGHPWPNTALPASMPVDPLRETSTQPPERAADQDQTPDHKQITSRSQADHKQITSKSQAALVACTLLHRAWNSARMPHSISRSDGARLMCNADRLLESRFYGGVKL